MSNIDIVIGFIKAEPNYDKAAMVEKIVKALKVTKSNAQVYLYNANKKMGNPTSTKRGKKAVTLPKISAGVTAGKADEFIKSKNLETIKKVSKRQKEEAERLAKREEMMAVVDAYHDEEVAPFVAALTAPARKTFQLAE